jgi:hypothetical protein
MDKSINRTRLVQIFDDYDHCPSPWIFHGLSARPFGEQWRSAVSKPNQAISLHLTDEAQAPKHRLLQSFISLFIDDGGMVECSSQLRGPISGYTCISNLDSADLERGHRQLGEPTDAGACYRDAVAIVIWHKVAPSCCSVFIVVPHERD